MNRVAAEGWQDDDPEADSAFESSRTTRASISWSCSWTSVPRRPTDWRRVSEGEVSRLDLATVPADEHTTVAELAIERAKRPCRARQGRRDHPGRDHPSRPGLQPGPAGNRSHHVRRRVTPAPLYPPKKVSSEQLATSRRGRPRFTILATALGGNAIEDG